MKAVWTMVALLAAVFVAAGCATKKGFEQPGFAFGCPVGEAKVGPMDDLVKVKTASEGRRTTIQATEVRCTKPKRSPSWVTMTGARAASRFTPAPVHGMPTASSRASDDRIAASP